MTMTAEKNDVNGTRLVHTRLRAVGRKVGIFGAVAHSGISDKYRLPVRSQYVREEHRGGEDSN
jgi:hypothetical protein